MTVSLDSPPTLKNMREDGFVPPKVGVGTLVKWLRPGHVGDYSSAIVQRVNSDFSVALTVFPQPNGANAGAWLDQSKPSVLHLNDPRLTNDARNRYGAWDITDEHKERLQLIALVQELERKLKK